MTTISTEVYIRLDSEGDSLSRRLSIWYVRLSVLYKREWYESSLIWHLYIRQKLLLYIAWSGLTIFSIVGGGREWCARDHRGHCHHRESLSRRVCVSSSVGVDQNTRFRFNYSSEIVRSTLTCSCFWYSGHQHSSPDEYPSLSSEVHRLDAWSLRTWKPTSDMIE